MVKIYIKNLVVDFTTVETPDSVVVVAISKKYGYGTSPVICYAPKNQLTLVTTCTTEANHPTLIPYQTQVDHVGCQRVASKITCVFTGPDRTFIQADIGSYIDTATKPAVTNIKTYLMYKDYRPEAVLVDSKYITLPSTSFENNENSVLMYRRQDNGGDQWLKGALNGDKYGLNSYYLPKTQFAIAENGGTHLLMTTYGQAKSVRAFPLADPTLDLSSTNMDMINQACIKITGASNVGCIGLGNVLYRVTPNQLNGGHKFADTDLRISFWWWFWMIFFFVCLAILLIACFGIIAFLCLGGKGGKGGKTVKPQNVGYQQTEQNDMTRNVNFGREDDQLAMDVLDRTQYTNRRLF